MASSFTLDVKKFADGFSGGAEQAIRGTTISLWDQIILGSPVDEGRFRANWFASGATPSSEVNIDAKDRSGAATVSRATNFVALETDWNSFSLTNNLPYAEVIEFGSYPGHGDDTIDGFSTQAPKGVVRVTIKRFNSLLAKEAKKALPK